MSETSGEYPVKEYGHSVDDWFNLFYRVGKATRRSKTARGEEGSQSIERSLHSRIARANILKSLRSQQIISPIRIQEAFAKGKKFDEIDRQFADQKTLAINLSGLGTQKAFYADIQLPIQETQETEPKPPVFIIPALSGDLYGIEPIIRELAYQGRRVVSVAYPESFHGKTTEQFASAVDLSETYYPHTAYFKKAIEQLLQEGDIELWGYSTGGPIVAELLSDPDMQEKVTNAVIVAPASCVDQSKLSFRVGVLNEFKEVAKNIGGFSNISVVYGRKTPGDSGMLRRRKSIFNALLYGKVCKQTQAWKDMKVENNGKITFVLGGKDQITKGYSKFKDFAALPNSQVRVIGYPKWSHLSPLTHARELVQKVTDEQH